MAGVFYSPGIIIVFQGDIKSMTNQLDEKSEGVPIRQGVKAVASTVAGASLGVAGGIAAITAAAAAEILLPVGLCLWTIGLAGGAIGLLFGSKNKQKD